MTATIVDFDALAAEQVGVPYVFGGTGLAGSSSPGLDCSGLIYAVSLALGVTVPRTSEAQFSGLPRPSSLRQGDLIFYDVPTDDQPQPAHVAIWWDENQVLQAPHTGEDVMFSAPLPYSIMGYGRLPFPNQPLPVTEEEPVSLAISADGSTVAAIRSDGHLIVATSSGGASGWDTAGLADLTDRGEATDAAGGPWTFPTT